MFFSNLVKKMKPGKKSDPAMSSMAADKMSSHATATIGGKVVADAESWETVEGNIYVSTLSVLESWVS